MEEPPPIYHDPTQDPNAAARAYTPRPAVPPTGETLPPLVTPPPGAGMSASERLAHAGDASDAYRPPRRGRIRKITNGLGNVATSLFRRANRDPYSSDPYADDPSSDYDYTPTPAHEAPDLTPDELLQLRADQREAKQRYRQHRRAQRQGMTREEKRAASLEAKAGPQIRNREGTIPAGEFGRPDPEPRRVDPNAERFINQEYDDILRLAEAGDREALHDYAAYALENYAFLSRIADNNWLPALRNRAERERAIVIRDVLDQPIDSLRPRDEVYEDIQDPQAYREHGTDRDPNVRAEMNRHLNNIAQQSMFLASHSINPQQRERSQALLNGAIADLNTLLRTNRDYSTEVELWLANHEATTRRLDEKANSLAGGVGSAAKDYLRADTRAQESRAAYTRTISGRPSAAEVAGAQLLVGQNVALRKKAIGADVRAQIGLHREAAIVGNVRSAIEAGDLVLYGMSADERDTLTRHNNESQRLLDAILDRREQNPADVTAQHDLFVLLGHRMPRFIDSLERAIAGIPSDVRDPRRRELMRWRDRAINQWRWGRYHEAAIRINENETRAREYGNPDYLRGRHPVVRLDEETIAFHDGSGMALTEDGSIVPNPRAGLL